MCSTFPTHFAPLLLAALAGAAHAQCPAGWLPPDNPSVVDGPVNAAVAWDPDGPGPLAPVLVVGGAFHTAGAATVNNLAACNTSDLSWTSIGGGVNGTVRALAVFPNGDLVVAGSFSLAGGVPANSIARWNGAAWTPFASGLNSTVNALAVLPSGDLIAAGAFTTAGGLPASRIARWDGAAWTPFGAGVGPGVNALAVLPSGDIIVGGTFTTAGGLPANAIARWNGAAWSALGSGVDGAVNALAVLPNGDVAAGGAFANAGGARAKSIARWDGAAWSPMGAGLSNSITGPSPSVNALLVRPDGDLVAAGNFSASGPRTTTMVARWPLGGSAWRPFLENALGPFSGPIGALTMLPTGELIAAQAAGSPGRISRGRPEGWDALSVDLDAFAPMIAAGPLGGVVAAGVASAHGVPLNKLTRWDAFAGLWRPVVDFAHAPGDIQLIAADAAGRILIFGPFDHAGDTPANQMARWSGSQWEDVGLPYGGPPAEISAIAMLPDGDCVVGGYMFMPTGGGDEVAYTGVARRTAQGWLPASWGTDSDAVCFASLPNRDLIVGGLFTHAGGVPANSIARWDGRAWSPLSDGAADFVPSVLALPNGDVAAVGTFTSNSGQTFQGVGRWNARHGWTLIAPGITDVESLALAANGDLIAAGMFTSAGGVPANHLARWNGLSWSPLGSGASGLGRIFLGVALNGDLFVSGDGFGLNRFRDEVRPSATFAAPAGSARFSALCDRQGPVSYQWRRHVGDAWVPLADSPGRIEGAASPGLTISNISPADLGSYDCVLTTPCGAPFSVPPASLTLAACGEAVANGLFEDDLSHWTSSGAPASLVTAPGAPHAMSVGCALLPAGGSLAQTLAASPPAWSGLTCWARRASPGEPASLEVSAAGVSGGSAVELTTRFDLSDDWREYALDAAPADFAAASISFRGADASGPTSSVLIDDVSVKTSHLPGILGEPQDAVACSRRPFRLDASVVGGPATAAQWSFNGVPIPGASSPTLIIPSPSPAHSGLYRCTFTNGCGSTPTREAAISFLPSADFNRDGFLDFFDYDDFVAAFETGDPASDANGDGFLDFFDYDDFVAAFEAGC